MTTDTNALIQRLSARILEHFHEGDWRRIALLLDAERLTTGHSRLMRALHFGDKDYEIQVFDVLRNLAAADSTHLSNLQAYLDEKYPLAALNISSASGLASELDITVSPKLFSLPDAPQERDLIAAMLPAGSEWDPVFAAIKSAAEAAGFKCERVSDVWGEGSLFQEVFELVYRSHLVVADLSARDPNVFYQLGIAHLLGRTQITMAQSKEDLPFDLRRLRFLKYQPDAAGLAKMAEELEKKLSKHAPQ